MVESYYPKSYEEALNLLSQEEVTIVAGGTDLMVRRRNWATLPPKFDGPVMFVSGLEELDYIDRKGSQVHIGSGVTLEEIMDDYHTPELLRRAIKVMASPAIRHTGTLAGNVVNASPAGDSLPVLYLLDAVVVLESAYGMRHVPIEAFITGPGQTAINNDELIKEIVLTDHHFNHMVYKKVGGRRADAISKVCFVGAASVKKHVIEDFRMAFGAVAPTAVRRKDLEDKVKGKEVQWLEKHLDVMVGYFDESIQPIDDQRSSAVYRKTICRNMMKDFMQFK